MKTGRSVLAFRIATAAFAGLVLTSSVWAHYLWVTIDSKSGDHGTTNVYFEGGAGPGDGQYNDPFVKRGKTWIQTLDSEKPAEIKMADTKKPGKRWLSGELPAGGPRSITSYGKWGIYTYGKSEVLLHYYSKLIDAESADDFYQLGRSKQLTLDVVPVQAESGYALQLFWKDKPVAGTTIQIRGPKGFSATPKTDDEGLVKFETDVTGQFTVKAVFEEKEKGEFEEKPYDLIRHNYTMLMTFPKK